MSYGIHITRASKWFESMSESISLEELKTYFNSKADFEYSNDYSIPGPGSSVFSVKGDFFIWTHEEYKVPFSYHEGRITVSRAGDEEIEKMKEIAIDLTAVVQGDEGEIY